jgi:hypothetical protein
VLALKPDWKMDNIFFLVKTIFANFTWRKDKSHQILLTNFFKKVQNFSLSVKEMNIKYWFCNFQKRNFINFLDELGLFIEEKLVQHSLLFGKFLALFLFPKFILLQKSLTIVLFLFYSSLQRLVCKGKCYVHPMIWSSIDPIDFWTSGTSGSHHTIG